MSPQIIIDGYNMINRVKDLRRSLDADLETARKNLVARLRAYQATKRVNIRVVFDGSNVLCLNPEGDTRSGVQVLFSKPPQKADPLIKELIRKEQNKKALIVVSSDNDIILFARTHGAQVLSPQDFYRRITKRFSEAYINYKYELEMPDEELKEWMKLFGET